MRQGNGKEKKIKRVPLLKSEKAIAKFWDTHDSTEYLDDMEEVKEPFELDPRLEKKIRERHKKRLLTLRLEQGQIDDARRIAVKKGVGYQTLLREWIVLGIHQEWKTRASGRIA